MESYYKWILLIEIVLIKLDFILVYVPSPSLPFLRKGIAYGWGGEGEDLNNKKL
jgi:hypothetical protein